jgi:hypothetical protein
MYVGECEEYFRYLGLSLGRQQVVDSYMVFDGVPYYMSLMDTQASLAQSINQLRFSKGAKLATEFYQLYATLFGKDNRHREIAAAQVDPVIDHADGIINLCEMKYSNQQFAIDKAYEMSLRNKRGAFETETRTKKGVHLTLVSTYGLLRNSHSGVIQSQVTMDDLFG